jgi:hypothetical protein
LGSDLNHNQNPQVIYLLVGYCITALTKRKMAKSVKTTRYIIDASCQFDDGNGNAAVWFVGKKAVVANRQDELIPPFSSCRVVRTASKMRWVLYSLEKRGFKVCVMRLITIRKGGKVTKRDRRFYE